MSVVVLNLPDVKSEAEGRPERCPSCKIKEPRRIGDDGVSPFPLIFPHQFWDKHSGKSLLCARKGC
jgi:hypothetical protein